MSTPQPTSADPLSSCPELRSAAACAAEFFGAGRLFKGGLVWDLKGRGDARAVQVRLCALPRHCAWIYDSSLGSVHALRVIDLMAPGNLLELRRVLGEVAMVAVREEGA